MRPVTLGNVTIRFEPGRMRHPGGRVPAPPPPGAAAISWFELRPAAKMLAVAGTTRLSSEEASSGSGSGFMTDRGVASFVAFETGSGANRLLGSDSGSEQAKELSQVSRSPPL